MKPAVTKLTEKKEEAILDRLQLTKGQVSELREKCETLKPKSGNRENLICRECSGSIEVGQEVALKSSLGEIKAYYQRPP